MTEAARLHNASMDRAEMAFLARTRREYREAERLFRESLDLELAAIRLIEDRPLEPSYSILHRSAATLALDCNDPRLAEKLIGKALAHDPPEEVAEELRDLLEQVYFRRHLQLRGMILAEDELQMSLAGQGVGFGLVQSREFLKRVDDASRLIYRTVERRLNRPFRERGRPKQAIKDDYEVFLSLPRAASYAITLKLGRPMDQQTLLPVLATSEIINEFMDVMSLVNAADFGQLETRIPDPAYRRNCVELARRIAPDGENVRIVGFTTVQHEQERTVEVTRPKTMIVSPQQPRGDASGAAERVSIRGVLRFADATHDRHVIRVVNEQSGETHKVKVPEGMMNDIVKPLWDSSVVITGTRTEKHVMLETIEEE